MDLTVDGKTVHAATGGRDFDASLPAVIFVHGAGMDRTAWALQTRYFAYHGRGVLAVDLPGHGKSEGPALESVPAIADWLAALIEAAGLDRAALVGHSMGALAALDCAGRYPDRVRALALLGVAPKMPVHPDLLAAAKANDASAWDAITVWGHSRAAQIGRDEIPGIWMVGGGVRLLERAAPGVLYTDLAACNAYEDGQTVASAVKCPVSIILGEADQMASVGGGARLISQFRGASVVMLPGAGHMLMTERPNHVLSLLIEFFDRVEKPQA